MASARRERKKPALLREAVPPQPGTVAYLESSVLVAGILAEDVRAGAAVRRSGLSASALTIAEARRAVIRAAVAGRIGATGAIRALDAIQRVEAGCTILPISAAILERAGRRFPVEPIRTLDAVHLASAELLAGPGIVVTMLSYDVRIRENAVALGFAVG